MLKLYELVVERALFLFVEFNFTIFENNHTDIFDGDSFLLKYVQALLYWIPIWRFSLIWCSRFLSVCPFVATMCSTKIQNKSWKKHICINKLLMWRYSSKWYLAKNVFTITYRVFKNRDYWKKLLQLRNDCRKAKIGLRFWHFVNILRLFVLASPSIAIYQYGFCFWVHLFLELCALDWILDY